MSDPLDLLISRYLDGTASADDVRRLDARLQEDAESRRDLILDAAQDTLLRECLAELAPVPGAVPLRRPRWVVRSVMAVAAVVIAAVSLVLLCERYPMPQALGSYTVRGGGPVERGSVLTAGAEGAAVALGGYCQVDLQPGSTMRIEGARRAEQVFIEQGGVVCEADRGVGAFDVATSVGTASVTGTLFAVWLTDEDGERALFDRRMSVEVLVGSVLVSGTWGEMVVHAGETAALPPPEAAVREVLASLGLPEAVRATPERQLVGPQVVELLAEYRAALRRRFFDAAQKTLRTAMPKAMSAKVRPKVQAIRRKLRAGPASASDLARIRLAVEQRARQTMMELIHRTADQLAEEAAGDDRLMAWLLAQHIRAKLPGDTIAAFDVGLVERGIADTAPDYVVRASDAVRAAIETHDPDITGVVDAKTGAVVAGEEGGSPVSDEALEKGVRRRIGSALGTIGLPPEQLEKLEALLTAYDFRTERMAYRVEVRERLFDAARTRLRTMMSQRMAKKVQAEIMAVRERAAADGPPSVTDRARVQRAVMARARTKMMHMLHGIVDDVARRAAEDERLLAARVAKALRQKLPRDRTEAFNDALQKAGLSDDEAEYLAETEKRIGEAVNRHEPDLTDIVDPKTGEVILGDGGRRGLAMSENRIALLSRPVNRGARTAVVGYVCQMATSDLGWWR